MDDTSIDIFRNFCEMELKKMQKWTKKCRILMMGMLVLMLCIGVRVSAAENSRISDGFHTVNGKTYYYRNGTILKGWLTLNGKKYYFDSKTGVQLKGWQRDSTGKYIRYFSLSKGMMATGFLKSASGNIWYFHPDTGLLNYGWLKQNGAYYYSGKNGILLKGWVKGSEGKLRYFSSTTGKMAAGWIMSGDKKRYFSKTSGYMCTGAVKIGDARYYFDPSSGLLQTGFVKYKGNLYYMDPRTGGKLHKGWLTLGSRKYYAGSGGSIYMNRVAKIDSKYYGFASDGEMYVDTIAMIGGTIYVFDKHGAASYYKTGMKIDTGKLKSLGNFKITFYCPCYSCSEGWGSAVSNPCSSSIHNLSGNSGAVANHTIAVDPSVIPFGTAVVINGKIYVAEDRGGGVRGKHIDIYVRQHSDIYKQGFNSAEVFLLGTQ